MSLIRSFFKQKATNPLKKGLTKTHQNLFTKISRSILGKSKVDEDVLDDLEDALIRSDIGVETSLKIIKHLEAYIKKNKYLNTQELYPVLYKQISAMLPDLKENIKVPKPPFVMLVVGVNGVGKTTTIGKLAARFKRQGKQVILGAADTFRAAAIDQLFLWGERVGVEVVSTTSKDPSSVAYSTLQKAIAQQADIVIIDTAGRLHTKLNLMNELAKIKRVIKKAIPQAPHEILLVLDGSTGQNAIIQTESFSKITQINALAITKLDGTAKGGIVIGIADKFQIPIKYIGVGEKVEDLQDFDKTLFVKSLFEQH